MQTVVNLTQEIVMAEIESMLDTYPYSHQQAFAIPDLHQELITYVVDRVPCLDSTGHSEESSNTKLSRECLLQQIQLEHLIHEGICSIMQAKSDWIDRHLPSKVESVVEPSHWFG